MGRCGNRHLQKELLRTRRHGQTRHSVTKRTKTFSQHALVSDSTEGYSERMLKRQVSDQTSEYAAVMRGFFESFERSWLLDPRQAALSYAKYFWSGDREAHLVNLPRVIPDDDINNLTLTISDNHSLSELTKRVQLIGDITTITHFGEQEHQFGGYQDTPPVGPAREMNHQAFIRCPDLAELGKWLIDCRPLLEAGDVFYYPDINVHWDIQDVMGGVPKQVAETVAPLADVLLGNGKIIDQHISRFKKSQMLYPILSVELPFVDDASLPSFANLSLEHRDLLRNARDAFRAKFLSFDGIVGSEKLETEIIRFSIELRESIRELNSAYIKMKRSAVFSRVGASLGIVSAVLALAHCLAPTEAIIGADAIGSIAFLKALQDEMSRRQELKERPFYFLWLLKRSA
jgi:hypothetical protein